MRRNNLPASERVPAHFADGTPDFVKEAGAQLGADATLVAERFNELLVRLRMKPIGLHRSAILRARAMTSSPGRPVSPPLWMSFTRRQISVRQAGFIHTVPRQEYAIHQFCHDILGPLAGFFDDLFEGH